MKLRRVIWHRARSDAIHPDAAKIAEIAGQQIKLSHYQPVCSGQARRAATQTGRLGVTIAEELAKTRPLVTNAGDLAILVAAATELAGHGRFGRLKLRA